jgi:hypothetical protein
LLPLLTLTLFTFCQYHLLETKETDLD